MHGFVNSNVNGKTTFLEIEFSDAHCQSILNEDRDMMMIGNARNDLELLIREITNKTDTILNHSSHLNQSRGEISLLGR